MNALPEWMYSIHIPEGTVGAKLPPNTCFMKLNIMAKNHTLQISPNYTLGKYYANNDVKVTPTGITVADKVIPATMGVLSEEPDNIIASVNATVLSYSTRVSPSGKEVSDVIFPPKLKVPSVSFSSFREIIKNTTKSEVVARDEIYQQCYGQPDLNYKLHSKIGESLPNYTDNDQVTQTMGFPCKLVGVPTGFDVQVSDNVGGMYRLKQDASAARGEENGKGSLTSGYLTFDMLPNDAKILNTIRDFRNIMRVTNSKIISLPASKISHEVALSLSTEFIVEYEGSSIYPPYKDEKNGIFSSIVSDLPMMRFKHIASNDIRPTVTKKLVDYHDDVLKNVISLLKLDKRYFTYLYITPKQDSSLSYFPVSDADSLRVIAFARREIESPSVAHFVVRSCIAMGFRNNYPFYRKSFFNSDPFADTINWIEPIVIKTARIKRVQETYSVHSVAFDSVQMPSSILKKVGETKVTQRTIIPQASKVPPALMEFVDSLPANVSQIIASISVRESEIPGNIVAAMESVGINAVLELLAKKKKIPINELLTAYDLNAKRSLRSEVVRPSQPLVNTVPPTIQNTSPPEPIEKFNDNRDTDQQPEEEFFDDGEEKIDISQFNLTQVRTGMSLDIFKNKS